LWAKFLKVFLVLMIFSCSLITIYPNDRALASSWSPSSKAIATKVLRGVGEKIGIKWTAKALAAAVGFSLGAENLVPFWSDWTAKHESVPLDADNGEYRLTPDEFADMTDVLKESIDPVVPDTIIPIYGICNNDTVEFIHYGFQIVHYGGWSWNVTHGDIISDSATLINVTPYPSNTSVFFMGTIRLFNKGVFVRDLADLTFYRDGPTPIAFSDCNYHVQSTDPPDISNVNTNIWNTTTNNYNYYNDYQVIIKTAGDGTENVDVPVNPPMTPEETGNITDPPPPPPPPPDTDNDGIPDSTDITPGGEVPVPDDTGIFAKLFPILLILKLFGVLGSCLMYLLRMFTFIMTIPGIDAIPIDNTAFDWFRNASIVGIKIYDVVTSLASVGLSFIVFRAIRRAYL
jgi:hypothetical protein